MIFLNINFHKEISNIISRIENETAHHYIHQYVDTPPIPFSRLRLFYLFLKSNGHSSDQIERYCLAVSLVQMGLDTHDMISEQKLKTLREIRTRQLTVLSGDYFSSKYYYLLSKDEDIEVVKILAHSIMKVNELKMILYGQALNCKVKSADYLEQRVKIDTLVFHELINHFSSTPNISFIWNYFLLQLYKIELLLTDYQLYKWQNKLGNYLSLLAKEISGYSILRWLEEKVDELFDQIETKIVGLYDEAIKKEMLCMIKHLATQFSSTSRLLEEM